MGYTKAVISGFSWLAAIRIATRGLAFLRTPIIARVLSPSQVGLFALAAIILSLAETLTETGINIFLVQKNEEINKYISTAWITSLIRGFVIGIGIFVAAPFIVAFFNFPESLGLIRLISLVPIIRGFINPSVVGFIKNLQFRREFMYRTLILSVETLVSLSLVLRFQSPVSLVWGMIAGALFEVGLSYLMARPFPTFTFRKPLFLEVISRGKWLTATGVFTYFYQNADSLVVGKILGSASLGLYDYMYKVSMLPMTEVSDVIARASFPVFVKIAGDTKRLWRAYLRTVFLTIFFAVPAGGILFFFPGVIIGLLLGDKWLAGVPVLKVLALLGVIRSLASSVLAPFYALQKQEYMTSITFLSLIGLGVTIVPFVQEWGLVGAGYAALFGSLLPLPLILYYLHLVFRKGTHYESRTKLGNATL